MERIDLMIAPAPDDQGTPDDPLVIDSGNWVRASTSAILLKGKDGKIPMGVIPVQARIGSIPDWTAKVDWLQWASCRYRDSIFRANGAIPKGTPFSVGKGPTQWTPIANGGIINVFDWEVYVDAGEAQVFAGQMFYYRGGLYRAAADSSGGSITDTSLFEPLTDFSPSPPHSTESDYGKDQFLTYYGNLVQTNSPVSGHHKFVWGVPNGQEQTQTFRPWLDNSCHFPLTWKGVIVPETFYSKGEVVAYVDDASSLYVCIQDGTWVPNWNEMYIDPSKWVMLVNGAPLLDLTSFQSKEEPLRIFKFSTKRGYLKGDAVRDPEDDTIIRMAKLDIEAGPFTSGHWAKISEAAVGLPGCDTDGRKANKYPGGGYGGDFYYCFDLDEVLLHRGDTWAANDGIREYIAFPEPPKDGEVFTSRVGTKYVYNAEECRWRITSYPAGQAMNTENNRIIVSRNGAQTVDSGNNSYWIPNRVMYTKGDLVLNTEKGSVMLYANRSYEIRFSVSATIAENTQATFGLKDRNTGLVIENQLMARLDTTRTGVATPSGRLTIDVGANNVQLACSCVWTNSSSVQVYGIEGLSDNGDSWIDIVEVGKTEWTDSRVKQETLDGVYADNMMATVASQVVIPAGAQGVLIPFGRNISIFGEISNSQGRVFLAANKTYRLEASLTAAIFAGSRMTYRWYSYPENKALPGIAGAISTEGDNFSHTSSAVSFFTPKSPTYVELRVDFNNTKSEVVVVGDETGLGGSFISIQQIGASKTIDRVVETSKDDPKNYLTRDEYRGQFNYKSDITDTYFQSYTNKIEALEVAMRVQQRGLSETSGEFVSRFWFIMQKFIPLVSGSHIGLVCAALGGMQLATNRGERLNEGGLVNLATPNIQLNGSLSKIALQQVVPGNVYPTETTNWIKLIIGKDNNTNIVFVPLCLIGDADDHVRDIAYMRADRKWVPFRFNTEADIPLIITADAALVPPSTKFPLSPVNSTIDEGHPAVQLATHRYYVG